MGFSSKKTQTRQVTTPTNPAWVEPQLSSLAGRITDLSKMDPYGFVAGANGLQKQAYTSAGKLAPDVASYNGAKGLFGGLMDASTPQYDPATVRPNSILPNLNAYMSPYLKQVVDTSLADYDFGAGQTRAQNRLALAGDETFGGSGGSIQTAMSEDNILRGRGALSAQLHDQGFQTGANLANLDADRRQQAQLANMAAFNRAREFNNTQYETALSRQADAARGLVDAANASNQAEIAGLGVQSAIGESLQKIDQQRGQAPLDAIARLAGSYGSLPLSLLHGEISEGTTKQTGSVLDAIQQMMSIAQAGASFFPGGGAGKA